MRASPHAPPPSRPIRSPRTSSVVWERYRDNAARHLIGIGRDLQNRAMHDLTSDFGYKDLRPSLGPILSLVASQARPLGVLATQLAISPQACSQLVNFGETSGYMTREPDPADRRSRLVVLTPLGRRLVDDAVATLHGAEADYRELIGEHTFARLTTALGALFQGLDIPAHSDASLSRSSSDSIGVLPLISVFIQQSLMKATAAHGHGGLKMSHAQVLPLIGPDGARVSELARTQRMSRQAISATARDLEQLGYLKREADPRDLRGVVFRLTTKGTRLIEASVSALDELDEIFLRVLGNPRWVDLQSAARDLYQSLHLEEEIFEARSPSNGRDAGIDSERSDLHQLAANLRRTLGAQDAARLAALLDDARKLN